MPITIKHRADQDYKTGPIRTYAQVVDAMRKQGDTRITIQQIHWYEQSALKKLAELLIEYQDGA